ncbi:ABC transporter permease [Martelella radicis]|uniref:Putative spermidine/putrescine transport system permease protein n=1 Tax=Martelella radicis TaxID=1397476 RepID=A0A7W6P999_9HYPH|nr:ABC transporter permease [Martelella radicis]MBB4122047.1 putative spermidine/putrescine transport system permease protein [Martelella radicis]
MLKSPVTETQITHGDRLWLYLVVGLVMIFLVVPCILVIPMSFSAGEYLEFPPRELSLRWYRAFLGSPEWLGALWTSIKVAVPVTLIATALGTAAAWGMHRRYGPVFSLTRGLYMLPMLVPLILIAVGVFFVYAKIGLNGTLAGLIIAHSMLALPFVLVAVGNGLTSFDMDQHKVARSLGASEFVAFFTVTLPQIRISILSGAVFAFVTSFDEVVIALYISSGENETLTRRMFSNIRDQVDPTVAAVSSLLVGVVIISMALFLVLRKEDA